MNLPGDPYLPGGCTPKDIDRAFACDDDEDGDMCDECKVDFRVRFSNLCSRCLAVARADYERDRAKDEAAEKEWREKQ